MPYTYLDEIFSLKNSQKLRPIRTGPKKNLFVIIVIALPIRVQCLVNSFGQHGGVVGWRKREIENVTSFFKWNTDFPFRKDRCVCPFIRHMSKTSQFNILEKKITKKKKPQSFLKQRYTDSG